MAEAGAPVDAAEPPAKVRVVRCPKCDKLLPELAGFGVYRCGGCSATLQAALTPPRQEEAGGGTTEEQMQRGSMEAPMFSCLEEAPASSFKGSTDREKAGTNAGQPSGAGVHNAAGCVVGNCSSSLKSDCSSVGSRVEDGGSPSRLHSSKAPMSNGSFGMGETVKVDDTGGCSGERLHQVFQNGAMGHSYAGRKLGFQPSPAASPHAANPDEGPSHPPPLGRVNGLSGGKHVAYRNSGLPASVENLENDRMQLLKKLDELREQLNQSCKVADASHSGQNLYSDGFQDQKGFHDKDGWFRGGFSACNQPPASHSSLVNRDHNLPVQSYVPALHSQGEMIGCGMPFGKRMPLVAPCDPYNFCQQRGPANIACGQFDRDLLMPYPHGAYYHQSACSCPHFCNQQWRAPSHVPGSAFTHRRGSYHANSQGFYNVNGSLILDPNDHNEGTINSSMISNNPMNCERLPFGNFTRQDCRPLAGGAPFVVCCNCSELLQLPQKHLLMGMGQYKLRCGSCSQVILVGLDKDGLIICSPQSMISMNLESTHVNDHANPILVDSYYTGNFDRPCLNSRSAEERVALSSYPPLPVSRNGVLDKEEGMNLTEAENMERRSSSSSASRDERSPDALTQQRHASSSRELQKPEIHPRARGPPLREHFGYSPSSAITANRSGTGNRSKRSDQEKIVSVNGTFKQNSVKDVAVATELDLLVDEYPHPRLSEDSDEASKEDELPRNGKGGESFFTGLIKKSFKDFSRSNQHAENRKSKVSVNGHSLPDRIVKKAERVAGPIQPGEYWYDYQAGFWGVMGLHCLGIIPPFIEELSYPMPRNCAGGDTGVLVNGRELHQKDLDLLASRGLPTTRNRSYIVDISGKVSDAASGEELDGLGKLAPTIEKMKHGFGMRVLKELSD